MSIKEISSQDLATMMQGDEPPRLVDVRSAAEVMQGALTGAEHMVMHTVPLRMQDIDKDKPVVFYCRSGARSAQVCHFLMQQGIDNAINLRGGIMDWARNGFEVVRGDYMLNEAV